MSQQIVTVEVSQTAAPTPNALQKTGAFVSQGGTTLAAGTRQILSSVSALSSILQASLPLASLTQTGGVATATLKSTTVASGAYDTDTGIATLTLTATLGVHSGSPVKLDTVTGTGDFGDLDGIFNAAAGTAGTTLKIQLAAGLTMTITGGNAEASLGIQTDDEFWTTIAGATPTAYNGAVLATATGDKTFTFSVPSGTASPATGSVTATPPGVVELQQMNKSFWGQGSGQSVYVLELGAGDADAGIATLDAWIAANPGIFYSYLVPRSWDASADYVDFVNAFTALTAKAYFFTTTTAATYANYAGIKSVVPFVETPDAPTTDFQLACAFQITLNYAPSSTNKVTPLVFAFLFGATAYPQAGNLALLNALKAAGVNYVGSGAEGGLSNTILLWGTTGDRRPFAYWYSVDWIQINVDVDVANAVIAGSNNPANPLYYNQEGINRLQAVATNTLNRAIQGGLALGTVQQTEMLPAEFTTALDAGTFDGQLVINAVPFIPYVGANPGDYPAGAYNGFTVVYVTQNGFISILFVINVTDFVAQQ